MRRATGEWQQFVFKIVDDHLQCLTLKEVSELDAENVRRRSRYRLDHSITMKVVYMKQVWSIYRAYV